ncbi:MAG: hypothetical protein M0D55_02230 [Elusimicrobiota bacterium]|nr:MAG: hypothetical protein M0D55_02230 [Elusimicrobiota bacterium]
MTKPLFAVLSLALAVPSFASPADDAFNAVVNDINQAVGKIVAAQQRQSKERRIVAEQKAGAAAKCTPAQADEAYTALRRCDESFKKAFGAGVLDARGAVTKGFNYSPSMSLVLLTTTDAYFYHNDCDICAAVEKCSLKDGAISNFKSAHSVDCRDLAPELRKKGVVIVHSDCPLP